MADQQFVRARLLAEELMALPKAERAPHLREACGGDHGLYAAAQQLLNEAEAATSFLEEMNLDMTTGLVGSGKPVLPERIGPFRITRLIAAGGWSVIYEGLQKNPSRKVAIKVLHASLTSSSAQQRFTYESEVLARLRHPGIAEIFHAGTFDSSTGPCPYFALELIEEAMHFDTWAEKQQLSLDDRLEMFAYLCDIVHYGHTRGVVHCDLKPGNILIDREGRLRVIDFGIAMAVGDDGLQAADITETGRIVGTIHYMAPEQFSGDLERIDARTDVRALGVVLYELLTGQRPWDLSGIPAHEAMRLVQTKKPVPAGQLEPSLRGDLDTIIAKAMQDDPDDRYGSALELRQDVDRYRASLPIQARPPGTIRTARLFVRRHQISVGVATVVTLALCAALVVTLVAWRRAIRATANAEIAAAIAKREAARATSTTDVLTDMFSLAHPAVSAGGAIGVERMLDEATEYTGSAFQNDPESASKIRRALARIQLGVGDLDGAEANLSFIPPFEHPEDPAALETEVLRARVEHVRGDMNASESRLLAIINENPTSEDPSVIEALGTLAAVRVEQLDYPRAAPLLEKAIQRASRSLGPDDPKTIELQAQLGRTNAGLVMMRVPDAPDVNAPPPYGHLDRVVALLGATHPTTFLARLSESDPVVRTREDGATEPRTPSVNLRRCTRCTWPTPPKDAGNFDRVGGVPENARPEGCCRGPVPPVDRCLRRHHRPGTCPCRNRHARTR